MLTVPAYNESKNLRKCVELLLQTTPPLEEEFCIVIAENGSNDRTDIMAQDLERMYPTAIHLHASQKLGRGLALKRARAREFTSRPYNTLIRMMFKYHVFDHQIGF